MDNSYGMLALQKANLYILQEIDRICTKYKINYTLDSSTLLRAIRHGGFIPWDDDADIAMTRANFEAFRKIVKRELSDKLEFIMPNEFQGGKVFYDFTPRIIYKPSIRHKKQDKKDPYEGKLTTERKHKADNRKQADKDKNQNDKLTPEQILNY